MTGRLHDPRARAGWHGIAWRRTRRALTGRLRAGRPSTGRWRDERGSATAELAVGLPALMLLLLFSLGAVDAVIARMQCVDAARDAALAGARGGDGDGAGRDRAPRGASVSVDRSGERVRAEVSTVVRPLGPHLPGIAVWGVAVADAEPVQP